MTKKIISIEFSLAKITTEQFAILDENCELEDNIGISTNLNFGVDKENQIIAVFPAFTFYFNEKPFLKIISGCHFRISEVAWKEMLDTKKDSLKVPEAFIKHLTVISIGTARGILHAKTENTKFNKYFLPTINVEDLIKKDVEISLIE